MSAHDNILSFMQMRGPVLPVDVARQVGTDTLFAAAMLSELSQNGKIKISKLKVGGSPLYFLPDHKNKLLSYTKYLNGVERQALELLQKEKVVRASEATPPVRTALKQIKDFSMELLVKTNDVEETFFKFFLVGNDEAEKLIKNKLNMADEKPKKVEKVDETVKEEKPQEKKSEAKEEEPKKPEPKPIGEKETPKEMPEHAQEKQSSTSSLFPNDKFYSSLQVFFEKNNIAVHKAELVRKNSEFDIILSIPSSVGKLTYYCKAKKKKRVGDGDLSSAYVKGETKKLPVLFLTSGTLTKKAKDMLSNEFKNITIKSL